MRAPELQVAKRELALECDYAYEARSQAQFCALVRGDPELRDVVSVPDVIGELCTRHLLTTEWVPGAHIDKACVSTLHDCQHFAALLQMLYMLLTVNCEP